MIVKCEVCGREVKRYPSQLKKHVYCSSDCYKKVTRDYHPRNQVTKPCESCGKLVTRCQSQMLNHVFCSIECAKGFRSHNFSELAKKINPIRMTPEVRAKLRSSHLGKGKGKTYTKTFGRHTHRIIAEEMLGRPLRKGKVIHHIDGDKRNNNPLNLMIFSTQAEHATWHLNERFNPQKNYE